MATKEEKNPLLTDPEGSTSYGSKMTGGNADDQTTDRAFPTQEGRRMLMHSEATSRMAHSTENKSDTKSLQFYLQCIIYALVNVIIAAPGLFGYAAVIFNHPVFAGHMNALSKLVIFSSAVHQLGFALFSSLDFAIGMVQDAGLIFLSGMANIMANRMIDEGHSVDEIISTVVVLLAFGTAVLGLVLIIMGRYRLADAVSYLPMPVVGGYLAFIGYFCIQAGVALCISKPMMTLGDWKYILDAKSFMLAWPGLAAGLILTFVSRKATSSGALPVIMVAMPALFYFVLWVTGTSMEEVREEGWVGQTAPSVPVTDMFKLVNFGQVRWDLIPDILPTWIGMVFVVSFASCLDVAAISIDMGQPLDTNRELATVGMCNFMSGMTFGFTGSYIFSQTIFTYRTGTHSKLIGVLLMFSFLYIVVSPVNVLEIAPLFFLGSTLIFIGYDLVYEWLWEVRDQVFLSEYGIVWLTFAAIHVVGIDAGIILGVLVAVVEHIVTTASTSNVNRVLKRSRAVWTPDDTKLLHDFAYSSVAPKIVTVEVIGTVFFGTSLKVLNRMNEEIGIDQDEKVIGASTEGGHTSSNILTLEKKPSLGLTNRDVKVPPPKYVVLDLMGVTHLDASATRGCFLQLTKMCAKRGIIVCASGVTPRIEWMLRSHGVAIENETEEDATKARLLNSDGGRTGEAFEKILLFITVQDALEFCETSVIHRVNSLNRSQSLSQADGAEDRSLADVFAHILGSPNEELVALERLNSSRYHDEEVLNSGDVIFRKGAYADSFCVVLKGYVANATTNTQMQERQKQEVLSGAGLVAPPRLGESSDKFDKAFVRHGRAQGVTTVWQVGGVLGYTDFLLERPRICPALATQDGTRIARVTMSHMNLVKSEDPTLYNIFQRVLLNASTKDLANCTCHDV